MAVKTTPQKRSGSLALNRTQVGVACGFVGIGLLLAFGAGFIVGMWYQATEHITPGLASDTPVVAVEPPTRDQDLTFYSTLSPEPPPKVAGTAATAPPQTAPSPRGVAAAPPPPLASLPAPRVQERDASPGNLSAPQRNGGSSPAPVLPQPSEAGYSVQVGSFRAREEAERLRQRLTQKGYPVWIQPSVVVGQGIWYRVRVGHFADRAAADRAAQRLSNQERVSVMVTGEPGAR
jgi:cell division protein FtsN